MKKQNKILHSDRGFELEHGAIHQSVYNSIAYGYKSAEHLAAVFQGKRSGYSYGRQNNPTITALERLITILEQGTDSICFSTGMDAISSTLLSLLRSGDHLIASQFLFANTYSFFKTLDKLGIDVSFVDATNKNLFKRAILPNTKAVFVETIANPCTQISDVQGIGDICKESNLLYIVDNTLTSASLFIPKSVKASLVINSLSKSIAGHAHVLGGSVTDTGLFNWHAFNNIEPNYKKGGGLLQIRKKGLRDMGATLAPDSANKIALGMETLDLRVSKACKNALELAEYFAQHKAIRTVHYPGLERHPQHQLAKTIFNDFGFLLSINLVNEDKCFKFLNKLKVVILSSHLGDNRTLAIPVAHTIFYEAGEQWRKSIGVSSGTIRISVGIEVLQDLIKDFEQALSLL